MFTRIVKSTGLAARLRAVCRHEADQVSKPLRGEVARLRAELDRLHADVRAASERASRGDRNAAQLKSMFLLNQRQQDRLADASSILHEGRIAAHVREAVAAAPMETDPYEHIVVERLLPDDVYELLIEAIPPLSFFTDHDPIKQDLPLPMELGPTLATNVWGFMDDVIARRIIRPAVLQRFHEPLQRHFDVIFGEAFREQANGLPQSISGGRLMMRRPGYHLSPHRDPKRSLLTCLLYLARPGDSETYGTQIFRVVGDSEAGYKQTYYPEQEGRACELVKVVPFRPNSLLVFLNSRGAHGATIPADAPAETERYAYQFYIAPQNESLSALIKQLPRDRRTMWQNKNKVAVG